MSFEPLVLQASARWATAVAFTVAGFVLVFLTVVHRGVGGAVDDDSLGGPR